MTKVKSIDKLNNWNTWSSIKWKTVESQVFRLQKRIYRASQNGNVKLVHSLQRLLVKSYYGKLLSTRKVTQDNQGKKTAGVDGVKSLTPKQRLKIIGQLNLRGKCKPTRRVNIPKPNGETRPLGIPCMEDRIKQGLVKLAIEPQWEAKFEPNSYGFRPARSCHDAIQAIFNAIRYQPKYVLDADIAKCFDRIDHIIPKSKGGKDMYNNLQVLHRHCHDDKTANDGSLNRTHDKRFIVEELCEVKVSCTVLKTSQVREDLA